MVLSDVNGNNKKSTAERWLRQRNGQRASAVRCIFGPPEKRAQLAVIMRNEAEMERKRLEFAARYEPIGLSPNERRKFYDGLLKTSPTSSHRLNHQSNDNVKNMKPDQHYHYQQQPQQQQKKNNSFNQSDNEKY